VHSQAGAYGVASVVLLTAKSFRVALAQLKGRAGAERTGLCFWCWRVNETFWVGATKSISA
jgi:hypothetical protein